MTTYYLIPARWEGVKCAPATSHALDIIRKLEGSYKKANVAADEYERELNGGAPYSTEENYKRSSMYSVTAIPYSQARDYVAFTQWPCNKDGTE